MVRYTREDGIPKKGGKGIQKTHLLIGVLLVLGVAAIVGLGLFGEGSSPRGLEEGGKLKVIVSILPQKEFVEAVGGEHVEVSVLIPPGGSPATYEPGPGDLAKVEDADVYFMIGHIPFELSHSGEFASLNPSMKMVDTSENVKVRYFGENEEHSHGGEEGHEGEEAHGGEHEEEGFLEGLLGGEHDAEIDPHTWLSPMNVKVEVDSVAEALIEMDPANEQEYLENAESYKLELDALHDQIASDLSRIRRDKLMVFHPAWGYFADEFGLEQIAIEQDGKEPTPAQLQELIDIANEESINVIFVQSQFTKDIADSIALEVGALVVSVDPLAEDYTANMENVGRTIAIYLNN
ncbi:zinc ABC transporter substrate-binding protein [Candidatus Micrarchaeota archaeon]|nr:zinc ABC transporter substrate-binding protein [Candidatus Micrarchaeota archaeon]